MKSLFFSLVLVFSANAMADQCAYVSKDMATQALQKVAGSKKVQSYCLPCMNTQGAATYDIKSLGIADVDYQGYWELQINGQGVDIAYIYVDGKSLASLVSCPTVGVPEELP
ncbi:MAG: hypothetical protein H6623_02765 [Bdellovibrionaceae bacterium]|nr:hypothetical protein [Pseudobdellovibrionaceae bacterium]